MPNGVIRVGCGFVHCEILGHGHVWSPEAGNHDCMIGVVPSVGEIRRSAVFPRPRPTMFWLCGVGLFGKNFVQFLDELLFGCCLDEVLWYSLRVAVVGSTAQPLGFLVCVDVVIRSCSHLSTLRQERFHAGFFLRVHAPALVGYAVALHVDTRVAVPVAGLVVADPALGSSAGFEFAGTAKTGVAA